MVRAKAAEEIRDRALAKDDLFDFASAGLQLAIVLASASVVIGITWLAYLAGGVGIIGIVFALLGWFAPNSHFALISPASGARAELDAAWRELRGAKGHADGSRGECLRLPREPTLRGRRREVCVHAMNFICKRWTTEPERFTPTRSSKCRD